MATTPLFSWYALGVLPCLLKGEDIGPTGSVANFIVELTNSPTLASELTTESVSGGAPPLINAAKAFSLAHATRSAFRTIVWPDGFPIRIRSIAATQRQRFILDPQRLIVPWSFPVQSGTKKAAFEGAASVAITTNWPPQALSSSDHSDHAIFIDPVMHAADRLTKRGVIRHGQTSAEIKAALATEAATIPTTLTAYTHMAPNVPITGTQAWQDHSFSVITLDEERGKTHVTIEKVGENAFESIVLHLGVKANTNDEAESAEVAPADSTALDPSTHPFFFADWPCGAFE